MSLENYDPYSHHDYEDTRNLHDTCRRLMYYHVTVSTRDGRTYDGIIDHVDSDRMSMLVGEDVMEREEEYEGEDRQFYGFGRPRRRFRRFRRRDFPFASLAALALLPYIVPPPYPYYYPYPYPYPYY